MEKPFKIGIDWADFQADHNSQAVVTCFRLKEAITFGEEDTTWDKSNISDIQLHATYEPNVSSDIIYGISLRYQHQLLSHLRTQRQLLNHL